jgi:predicted RNA-binding Zn-ribbon protein involved in translation (DUF1610 family)
MFRDDFSAKRKANLKLEGRKEMRCPKTGCNNKINDEKQKKTESNFYFCKDCGTVVYRQDKK